MMRDTIEKLTSRYVVTDWIYLCILQVKGEYRVALPDGRVQIVSYTADEHGYRPHIRYEAAEKIHGNGPAVSYNEFNTNHSH